MRRSQSHNFTANEKAVHKLLTETPAALSIAEILTGADREMNEATAYRITARFVDAGYATASWRLPDNDARPIREFRLTDRGRAADGRFPTPPKVTPR